MGMPDGNAMTSGFSGPEGYDAFGEFLARFFGGPRPGPRQINIGQLLSQPARELVRGAAQYAAEHGSRDLDTQHLLRAALTAEPTRTLLSRVAPTPTRSPRRSTNAPAPSSTSRKRPRPPPRCPSPRPPSGPCWTPTTWPGPGAPVTSARSTS